MSYHFEDRDMTTKTYELVVKTNVDISKIYKMIGGYITGHSQIKESCEGDYPYDQDDVMEQYSDDTKSSNLYYDWWHKNTCFKGDYNDTPFALTAGVKSFYDSNFSSIIFSVNFSFSVLVLFWALKSISVVFPKPVLMVGQLIELWKA